MKRVRKLNDNSREFIQIKRLKDQNDQLRQLLWKWKSLSRVWLLPLHGLYSPWNSPGQNTGVGGLSLLQGIFPTQGSNPGLPNCRQILYQLSHKGSPRILKWVAHLSLLQQILPTQELNQDLLHCRQILYNLSYQGSP